MQKKLIFKIKNVPVEVNSHDADRWGPSGHNADIAYIIHKKILAAIVSGLVYLEFLLF